MWHDCRQRGPIASVTVSPWRKMSNFAITTWPAHFGARSKLGIGPLKKHIHVETKNVGTHAAKSRSDVTCSNCMAWHIARPVPPKGAYIIVILSHTASVWLRLLCFHYFVLLCIAYTAISNQGWNSGEAFFSTLYQLLYAPSALCELPYAPLYVDSRKHCPGLQDLSFQLFALFTKWCC